LLPDWIITTMPAMLDYTYISDRLYGSHIASRLMLGGGWLFFAVMTTSLWLCLILILLAAIVMRMLDGTWITSLRILRLLRWFVIPIVLLHAFFTPGQWLFPNLPVAISQEGLMRGVWLSVHLLGMYGMAILMFRLLKWHEWFQLLLVWPKLGNRLALPLLMMISMKKNSVELLAQLRLQFALRTDWRRMPQLLLGAFKQALSDAGSHARILWLRWPNHLPLSDAPSGCQLDNQPYLYAWLWAVAGCAGVMLSWL